MSVIPGQKIRPLKYVANVIDIERKSFDHGGTRTRLARLASGDLLLFFTQDALPATDDCISRLLRVFEDDPSIGCAYGRQLPGRDATLFAAHLRGFNYPPASSITGFGDRHEKGFRTIFISNTFAVYRAEVLRECGYFQDGLIFGEDTLTLGKILKAGYKVAYVADACVYHSHNYTLTEEFRRSFDTGVLHSSEKWLMQTFGGAENVGASYVASLLRKLFDEKKYGLLADWLLRCFLKAAGYKLGRHYDKIPKRLVPALSMNRLWWDRIEQLP